MRKQKLNSRNSHDGKKKRGGGKGMPLQRLTYSSIRTLNVGGFCGLHDEPQYERGSKDTRQYRMIQELS